MALVARLCSLKEDQAPADEDKSKSIVVAKSEVLSQALDVFIKDLDLI